MHKSEKYYSEKRSELSYYISGIKKPLEIWCSSATFTSTLKYRSLIEVWWIEMNEASAEIAKKNW